MSHFVVLVVGDDIKSQLQPFHEFECTGTDDEYVQDVDITDEVLASTMEPGPECLTVESAIEYHMGDDKIISDLSELDLSGMHKYGYALVKDGVLIKAVKRTNPNAKWDWWVLGGRWRGYFHLKQGCEGTYGEPGVFGSYEEHALRADACRWGDVDLVSMKRDARQEAEGIFAMWQAIYEMHGKPRTFEELRAVHGENIDAARAAYNNQRAVLAMRQEDRLRWKSVADLGFDRDAYVSLQERKAVIPFAILKDGVWHEKGKMGWWACVSDEKSDWLDQAEALLASIPEDATVSMVDCHI